MLKHNQLCILFLFGLALGVYAHSVALQTNNVLILMSMHILLACVACLLGYLFPTHLPLKCACNNIVVSLGVTPCVCVIFLSYPPPMAIAFCVTRDRGFDSLPQWLHSDGQQKA